MVQKSCMKIDAPKVNKNTAETNLINFEHKNKIKVSLLI